MESFFTRYRNLVVLLAILVAQIVGLAVQVRRTASGVNSLNPRDQSGVRLIRLWANAVISPPEEAIHAAKMGAIALWQNYLDLRGVRQQNQNLQKTVARLRLEQAELLGDARQGERLQALLGFQERYIYKTIAAQVYGSSGSGQSHVFYIDKGSAEGVAQDMAVVTAEGIVGKVREVYPHSAQVLEIDDPTSGAGAILETTRIRGILRGNPQGQLEVVNILADERIKPGEQVLTAGGDMIFPRGLPIGVVQKVVPDPDRDGFIDVMVKPAAHLDSLDEVLVITSMQPRFPAQAQQDMATSEALDGAQAAAIEAQQKAAQITAEHLPNLMEPNVPASQQPINDSTPPVPMAQPPQPLHPDQFSPPATGEDQSGQAAGPAEGSSAAPATGRKNPRASGNGAAGPHSAAAAERARQTTPQRKP
jgi:rod shape-determining protein MreC